MGWRGSVFCLGEEFLHGFGIPFHELVERQLILLDQSIDLVYGRHLEITSTVETGSPFPKGVLRPSYAIHRSAWKAPAC